MREAPTRLDGILTRLTDLEHKLGGKHPPDVCKFCGERQVRMSSQYPLDKGALVNEEWTCAACNKTETRITSHS